MHHLNRFDDVQAAPVTAAERIRAGNAAYKLAKANVAVFEACFCRGQPFAGITSISKNLHINRVDHSLGAGLGIAHTGLPTTFWVDGTTGGNLLESHHPGANLARPAIAELGAIHLAGRGHAVTHQ